MLGDISCGQPRYTDEDHETYIEAAGNIQADFCLRAKGDSMIGARIMDGDIVFIREQPMVEDGEIAAVIIDDEATLKRVKYNKEKQQLTLFPANDKYDPLVYIGEELNQIRILGKAVCFMSNL
jgi:repressor LexA